MKVPVTMPVAEIEEALKGDGLIESGKGFWVKPGHLLSLAPDLIPYQVKVIENESGQIELNATPTYPFWHGLFASRLLELKFGDFQNSRVQPCIDFEAGTLAGGFSEIFYRISALFLGLLGVLVTLTVFLRCQLSSLAEEFTPRVRAFEVLLNDSGLSFIAFPDVAWIQQNMPDSLWGGALILAFLYTFLAGFIPVLTMMILSRGLTPGLFALIAALSGGFLAFQGHRGGLLDMAMWLVASFAVIPGYLLAMSWRIPRLRKGDAASYLSVAILYTLLIFVSWILLFSPTIALPRGAGNVLPDAHTPEAMLVIRDEVLKQTSFGRVVSNGYYNNVVVSNQYLRPPLSIRWTDSTVLTCGLGDDWSDALLAEHRVVCDVDRDELMDLVKSGLTDSQGRTGAGSFEILLIEKSLAGDDFAKEIEAADPSMLTRYLVVDGLELINPRLGSYLDKYEQRRPGDAHKVAGLMKKALYAVQTANDKTLFREEARGTGLLLITICGLPLLVVWTLSGLLTLVSRIPCGAPQAVLGLSSLLLMVWPLGGYWLSERGSPEAFWTAERSQTADLYNRLWALEGDPSFGEMGSHANLMTMEKDFKSHWNVAWMTKFDGLDKLSAKANARAWASLERVLESRFIYDKLWLRVKGVPPVLATPKNWSDLQTGALTRALSHPDPVVRYWALKCCLYVDSKHSELWDVVVRCLKDSSLNVRDRAAEALWMSSNVEHLKILRDHYVSSRKLETCDYVRLNQFMNLYLKRRHLDR